MEKGASWNDDELHGEYLGHDEYRGSSNISKVRYTTPLTLLGLGPNFWAAIGVTPAWGPNSSTGSGAEQGRRVPKPFFP